MWDYAYSDDNARVTNTNQVTGSYSLFANNKKHIQLGRTFRVLNHECETCYTRSAKTWTAVSTFTRSHQHLRLNGILLVNEINA